LQKFLEGKLEVLKRIFKQGHDLKVLWLPKQHRLVELGGERYLLSGEVVGSNIRIYESTKNKAIDTLVHEFTEHLIKEHFSKPYVMLLNVLTSALQSTAYKEQEEVIKALTEQLLKMPEVQKIIEKEVEPDCRDGTRTREGDKAEK